MATGNFFLGSARRKLGDVVMYRRNGKQVSRIRVTPRNPRSQKQNYQRMVFATLTKMASSLSTIVNHSFEGVKVGGASLNHFVKLNTPMARAKAYAAGGIADNFPAGFLIKSALGVACLPARISTGHLAPISQRFDESAPGQCTAVQLGVDNPQTLLAKTITSAQDYIDALAALGFQPGQQLTMVGIFTQVDDQGVPVQSYTYEATGAENVWTWPEFARIIFKQVDEIDFTSSFTFLTPSDAGEVFNPVMIDTAKSSSWVREVTVDVASGSNGISYTMNMDSSIVEGVASALIKSSYNGDGSWSYSTTDLCWSDDLLSWFANAGAALVAPSYGNAASAPDSTLYLRQADNGAPVAPASDPAVTGVRPSSGYDVDDNLVSLHAPAATAFQVDFNVSDMTVEQASSIVVKNGGEALTATINTSMLQSQGYIAIEVVHRLDTGELLEISLYYGSKLLWKGFVWAES